MNNPLFEPTRRPRRGGDLAAASPQALAEDIAAGLMQLAFVLREHPELAAALLWELSGLTPQLVIGPSTRSAIVATAAHAGATAAPARYSGPEFSGTVICFGELGAVRLLVPIPRPAEASGEPSANPTDHALVRARHDEPRATHAAATAGPGLVNLDPPTAAPALAPPSALAAAAPVPVDSVTEVLPVVRPGRHGHQAPIFAANGDHYTEAGLLCHAGPGDPVAVDGDGVAGEDDVR